MDKVMQNQNFTNYSYILDLIKGSEKLFQDIQMMESAMPLQDEERLFIDAIRDLNLQASRMQAEERQADDQQHDSLSSSAAQRIVDGNGPPTLPSNLYDDHPRSDGGSVAGEKEEKDAQEEEISEKLDAATSLLVDAAMKLNHSTTPSTSPDLHLALSWMHKTVKPTENDPITLEQSNLSTIAGDKRAKGEDGGGSVTDEEVKEEEEEHVSILGFHPPLPKKARVV